MMWLELHPWIVPLRLMRDSAGRLRLAVYIGDWTWKYLI